MQKTRGEKALIEHNVRGVSRIADSLGVDVQRYSGRGMYGAECVALFGDPTRILLLVGKHNSYFESLPPPLVDQLGRSSVVYWPQIQWSTWISLTEE